MKRYLFVCTFLLWYAAGLHAQQREILNCRDFKGTALYGYMNGGSDLYYEYGFENLKVTDMNFTFPGEGDRPVTEKYTVELYKTATPAGAFGLYSVHVNKYLQRDLYGLDCITRYQLQACFANIYLSIVFENPTEQALKGAMLLYGNYRDSLADGTVLQIPDEVKAHLFPGGKESLTGKVKFIKGPVALNNSLQDLYPAFDGAGAFELWAVETVSPRGGFAYKAIVYFSDQAERNSFLELNTGRIFSEDFAPLEIEQLPNNNALLIVLAEI